jgi:hypothetical protein
LCAGFTLLLGEDTPTIFLAPLSRVHEASKHHLLKFGSFSYWFNKPWFHTEGRLAAVLITPSLGVPNWSVIYINTAPSVIP